MGYFSNLSSFDEKVQDNIILDRAEGMGYDR